MATISSAPDNPISDRDATVAKEIRVSVVMYGGVSLAIYMNGVAQEMLRMVRSTARTKSGEQGTRFRFYDPDSPDDKNAPQGVCKGALDSTEGVYRKVARALNDAGVDDVRFIIDVISGTSAGGINGIFLAKALTDDSMNFDTLQSLWLEEGALEKLLNDPQTRKATGLPTEKYPKSLLCSDRMYLKLLGAFGSMKKDDTQPGESLVEQVDMFATTTDIRGRVIPLRLADMLVWEREYKQDFHFRFAEQGSDGLGDAVKGASPGTNDFDDRNNAFLAFVARCTSSFPFAFEPMQLSRAYELAFPSGKVPATDAERWDGFFDHSEQLETGKNKNRVFGDGGYLNNKPFSYVVQMLGRHNSKFPTERKLMYVDPTPDHPEDDAAQDTKETAENRNAPNALVNAWDALVKLPDAQPIHEDLQRVIDRNRLVRKVQDLSSMVTAEIYDPLSDTGEQKCSALNTSTVGDFSYLVTRVYATTDDLSKVMAQWFEYSDSSSFYYAIRCLVRAWRELQFKEIGSERLRGSNLARGYEQFLNHYDADYAKRRYRFVRQQINLFYTCDTPELRRLQQDFGIDIPRGEQKDFQRALIEAKGLFDAAHRVIGESLRQIRPSRPDPPGLIPLAFEILAKRVALFKTRNESDGLDLIDTERAENIENPSGTLSKSVVDYVLGTRARNGQQPMAPLSAQEDEDYIGRARKVVPGLATEIQQFADAMSKILVEARDKAANDVQAQLNAWTRKAESAQPDQWQTNGAQKALRIVEFFNRCFEQFDTAIFPLTYETDVSTPELVSIVRISPEDATGIFNIPPRTQKLAGASMAHFGAFLDRSFRTNDILWGRLDGAERIIHSMMATVRTSTATGGAAQRASDEKILIEEARKIILTDFLKARKGELAGVLLAVAKALSPPISDASQQAEAVRREVESTLDSLPSETFKEAISSFLTVDEIKTYLAQSPPKRQPDRQTTLESVSRSISIVGGMLQGLSEETEGAGRWIGRIGGTLWWIVQAANPKSTRGFLLRPTLSAVLWIEIFILIGGLIFSHAVFVVGVKMLIVTAVVWLIIQLLEQYLLDGVSGARRIIRKIALWLLLVVVLAGGLIFTPCGKILREHLKHRLHSPCANTTPDSGPCTFAR